MLYISFVHHTIWTEQDGIWYYQTGIEFFDGNSHNIQIINAPLGTPIIYAVLDDLFGMPSVTPIDRAFFETRVLIATCL